MARRRRPPAAPPCPPSPPVPPPPPPRSDSLRLSAEDMVLIANGGQRTSSGALAHFLAAYSPAELSLARSDYLRPPGSPPRLHPRSALSLRADSADVPSPYRVAYSSTHTLRRQPRALSPPTPPSPCDCLPLEPIPPPELFDF